MSLDTLILLITKPWENQSTHSVSLTSVKFSSFGTLKNEKKIWGQKHKFESSCQAVSQLWSLMCGWRNHISVSPEQNSTSLKILPSSSLGASGGGSPDPQEQSSPLHEVWPALSARLGGWFCQFCCLISLWIMRRVLSSIVQHTCGLWDGTRVENVNGALNLMLSDHS